MSRLPLLRADAVIVCTHETGIVKIEPSQDWVRSSDLPVLVEPDPEDRPVVGCPNLTVVTKPCTTTLKVRKGYSEFVRIAGRAVCLQTVTGGTDGTGAVFSYKVNLPGQQLVAERGAQ